VEILHESKITKPQLLILFLAFVAMLLDGLDILIIAFAAPAISSEFSFNTDQMGYIFSAALLGMAIGAMGFSSLADRYGRRAVVSLSLFVAGIATSAFNFAHFAETMMIIRFITGIGLGTFVAVLPTIGAEFSPLKFRNVIVSVLVAGIFIGSIAGGLIVSWALPIFGWRHLFLYVGLLTSVYALIFFWIVPESIQFQLNRKHENALRKINKTLGYLLQPPISSLPKSSPGTEEYASVKTLLAPVRRRQTILLWSVFLTIFATIFLSAVGYQNYWWTRAFQFPGG
jgi:MFS transporter, AAHS family, vanillate permease